MSILLTDEQKAITSSMEKYIEIEAGPGTGKTFTLCKKIEQLIRSGNLSSIEKILFCTFSNALTSSNLQSLSKNKEIDLSKVKTATLDSLLVELLSKLEIPVLDKDRLNKFEDNYDNSRNTANNLLDNMHAEILCLINLLVKRYPYIFIDEIQDIKDQEISSNIFPSPKYRFLELIKNSIYLKQLIIVGDKKQSIYNNNESFKKFSLSVQPHKLTISHRKQEHTGESHKEIINKVLVSSDTRKIKIEQAINLIKDGEYEHDTMILLNNLTGFNKKKELFTRPTFWYGGTFNGQQTLPQAFIQSLFWYNSSDWEFSKSSLESILLPFKPVLKKNITFSYFKTRYFHHLQNSQNIGSFLKILINSAFNKDHQKVVKLNSFYRNHEHLHNNTVESFEKKLIVSTIASSKGLEADNVFLFLNNADKYFRSEQEKFVSLTRHRKKLYICTY